MDLELLQDAFFEVLVEGNRPRARRLIEETMREGWSPEEIIVDIYWSVYERIERLFRSDAMTSMQHRIATRLLRVMVDQTAASLTIRPAPEGGVRRRVLACCGPTDADELAAQMAVDLLEAGGFEMTFAGGGIPMDEVLGRIHEQRPDVLLLFASAPSDLPEIRAMIDQLREIGACPDLQIVVGGGVFNRAEGLAEEIGADLWASDPLELVDEMLAQPDRRATPEQRTVGRSRRAKAA